MINPGEVAKRVLTTKGDLAWTLGYSPDALRRRRRAKSATVQGRLRLALEIIARAEVQLHSGILAYAWYRSHPIPGLRGETPRGLVLLGRSDLVHRYLDEEGERAFL